MTTIRTVQDVLDDRRKNDQRLEDSQEELEELQKDIILRQEKKVLLKKELESLKINLYKEEKIKFIECDLNTWRKHNEDDSASSSYFTYIYDGGIYSQGYFEGLSELEEKEEKHFYLFINDYFYYGYPLYIDRNHRDSEMTECELAFACGDACIHKLEWTL
jgi:hypothetical protein|tara:strand:- start:665 stop:1147 length:483 start_codon:yes stop_codon:yes gene_type:complete